MFDPKQVEEIHDVRYSMFSVARHFGGCKAQGVHYVYDPTRDVLVRADVHKKRAKAKAASPPEQAERTGEVEP